MVAQSSTHCHETYIPGKLVIVRGAGDLASGVILRLRRSGFPVLALEVAEPLAVRRTVSFSEAVREGSARVEEVTARLAASFDDAAALLAAEGLAVLVDPEAACLARFRPVCLVDAIMAKRNLGTGKGMAPLVIGLGPGFSAGLSGSVDAVIETMRGHDLGRVIHEGEAIPDTGVPGSIDGHGRDRVFHAPFAGRVLETRGIGEVIKEGEAVCVLEGSSSRAPILAPFPGVLRGMLREGCDVPKGTKIGDLDPRARPEHCHTVSDKSLAIAGGVLEALLSFLSGSRGATGDGEDGGSAP